jgi:trimeric autotransporter adhesin
MNRFALAALLLAVVGNAPAQRRDPGVITPDRKLAIKVTVDGEPLEFKDAVPIMAASRILVPMRGVFERLGATLNWDKANNKVTANANGKSIELKIGQNTAVMDGKATPLDQPAVLYKGRTMVPLRFLSEALGAKVDWLTADRTVAIHTGR